LGTVTGFAVAAVLNLYFLKKYTDFSFNPKQLIIKPIISVSIMWSFTFFGFNYLNNYLTTINFSYADIFSTLLIVFLSIFLYMILLIVFKEIKYADLKMIPYVGEKTADFFRKYNIL
jgi:stage V sporulation protein B